MTLRLRSTLRHRGRWRGFLFADALVAMLLMASIAAALLAARSAYVRVDRHLATQRAADRAAEAALVAMQTSDQWAANGQTKVIDVEGVAPVGWRWVRVELHHNARVVGKITGLVRRAS